MSDCPLATVWSL